MNRTRSVLAGVALAFVAAVSRAEEPSKQTSQLGTSPAASVAAESLAGPRVVPDPAWVPKVGRSAFVWNREAAPALAGVDMGTAETLANAIAADDRDAVGRLNAVHAVFPVAHMTGVTIREVRSSRGGPVVVRCILKDGEDKGATAWFPASSVWALMEQPADVGAIVKVGKPKETVLVVAYLSNHSTLLSLYARPDKFNFNKILKGDGGRVMKGGFTAFVMGSRGKDSQRLLNVRILDGEDKGLEGWVSARPAKVIKAAEGGEAPTSRAGVEMRIGGWFEKGGDRDAAIEHYRKAFRAAAPSSRESAEAEGRIKALGGKL